MNGTYRLSRQTILRTETRFSPLPRLSSTTINDPTRLSWPSLKTIQTRDSINSWFPSQTCDITQMAEINLQFT
jgi:hypothetical protein